MYNGKNSNDLCLLFPNNSFIFTLSKFVVGNFTLSCPFLVLPTPT